MLVIVKVLLVFLLYKRFLDTFRWYKHHTDPTKCCPCSECPPYAQERHAIKKKCMQDYMFKGSAEGTMSMTEVCLTDER